MSTWFCPQCRDRVVFASPDEETDFCAVHFVRLQFMPDDALPPSATELDATAVTPDEAVGAVPDIPAEAVAAAGRTASPVADELMVQAPILKTEMEPAAEPVDRSSVMESFTRLVGSVGLGKRKKGAVDSTVADTHKADDVLPPHERDDVGWNVVGVPCTTLAFDRWPVQCTMPAGPVHAVYTRYRSGALTSRAAYEKLLVANSPAMAHVYSFGTVQTGGGARSNYEITAAPIGEQLSVWMKRTTPGVDRARALLGSLVALLCDLRRAGVRPLVLTPEQVWISGNTLQLGVLGASAMTDGASQPQFAAELAGSPLLALPYAAPELIERRVIAPASEMFSIGQLVSEAVFGEAQDHAFVRDGSVPFGQAGEELLSRVLMGTLWPHPEQRWTLDDLARACESRGADLPDRLPWSSLRPGASAVALALAGEDHYLPEDLMHTAARHWDEALSNLGRILTWLESTRFAALPLLLRRQMTQEGRSAEWVLVRLHRYIVPEAPLLWRELALDDAHAQDSLAALAQKSLDEGPDGVRARELMEQLFNADLRGAFESATVQNSQDEQT